jgi:hypothetical protein
MATFITTAVRSSNPTNLKVVSNVCLFNISLGTGRHEVDVFEFQHDPI